MDNSQGSNVSCTTTLVSNYRPQRTCEGYVFTGVCLSTGGGGGEYLTRYTCPGADTPPPDQVHPLGPGAPPTRTRCTHPPPGTRYTSPGTRCTPWDQVHPPGPGTPPWDQVHPPDEIRPLLQTVRILLESILVLQIGCS